MQTQVEHTNHSQEDPSLLLIGDHWHGNRVVKAGKAWGSKLRRSSPWTTDYVSLQQQQFCKNPLKCYDWLYTGDSNVIMLWNPLTKPQAFVILEGWSK